MDNIKSRNYDVESQTVVWFNSIGLDDEGNSKKADVSFVENLDALVIILTQQLSVMKNELWHNITFGLPLLDKVKTKALIDSEVSKIILNNTNVIDIKEFSSYILNHKYFCKLKVTSVFGDLMLQV